jgi:hypothetical protein
MSAIFYSWIVSLPQHSLSSHYIGGLANIWKCFPADRVWPNKCDRCLAHRPEPLPCSEPGLDIRKRGPNIKDKTRDRTRDKTQDTQKEKEKSKDKTPKPPKRAATASTSDNNEPRSRDSTDAEDGGASSDDGASWERQRTEVVVARVREYPSSLPLNKEDSQ